MKRILVEQGTDEWRDFRKGKITGTRLRNIWVASEYLVADAKAKLQQYGIEIPKGYSTKAKLKELMPPEVEAELLIETWKTQEKKIGFYEAIAERLAVPVDDDPEDEYADARGLRLEEEAATKFSETYNKKLQVVGCWQSDENSSIINSPDREVVPKVKDVITEAVEIKCLGSARHIQAIVEDRVPDEFMSQVIQYFIVNDDLEKLYFVFYDDRIKSYPLKVIEVTRESLGNKIERYKQFQLLQIKEIEEIVERLAF